MRAPLTVRINDGTTDRLMSRRITGLRWRKTAPGGHADASCRIDLPASTFSNLGPADRMWVYDNQGRTMFDGYTNNPGTQLGREGEAFNVTAVGGMSRLSDKMQKLIYVDRLTEDWERDWTPLMPEPAIAEAAIGNTTFGGGGLNVQGLKVGFPRGIAIGIDSMSQIAYAKLVGTDMNLGGITILCLSGKTDVNYHVEFTTPVVSFAIADPTAMNTGGSSNTLWVGTDFPAAQRIFALRLRRLGGATNIADDSTWTFFWGVTVLVQRVDRFGNLLVGAAGLGTVNSVLAHQVVEDLLGRALDFCDPNTAVVETASYAIDQLAYVEGAKPIQVLEDLGQFEDMLYEVLESNAAGLHRFNYRAWPTTPRYQLPTTVPVTQQGSDFDLCNRIAVTWTDVNGARRITVVTSTVPELGTRTRDADPVTLPVGYGSALNAQRIGEQILAAKASPPKSARVTVAEPIVDMLTGAMVQPWEIEPGYLVRVVATGDDLRLTEMEYDDDSCSASLQLGEPMPTTEQRIARLDRAS